MLTRLNQIMPGWSAYFRHAVAKRIFAKIAAFAWRRVGTMVRHRHRWQSGDVRGWLIDPTGRWRRPAADGIELFDVGAVPVTRYRYRSKPQPLGPTRQHPLGRNRGELLRGDTHGGFGERPGETAREQSRNRAPGRLNHRSTDTATTIDATGLHDSDAGGAGEGR